MFGSTVHFQRKVEFFSPSILYIIQNTSCTCDSIFLQCGYRRQLNCCCCCCCCNFILPKLYFSQEDPSDCKTRYRHTSLPSRRRQCYRRNVMLIDKTLHAQTLHRTACRQSSERKDAIPNANQNICHIYSFVSASRLN